MELPAKVKMETSISEGSHMPYCFKEMLISHAHHFYLDLICNVDNK